MKLVLKGIETCGDARFCVEHGVDGILGRTRPTETYRATIECLPEVVDGVAGRIPVIVDGGIRRGTDVYKALAFGAKAVGIGRPYILGAVGVRAGGHGTASRIRKTKTKPRP
jgi:4-hydroxymandelate oxidase